MKLLGFMKTEYFIGNKQDNKPNWSSLFKFSVFREEMKNANGNLFKQELVLGERDIVSTGMVVIVGVNIS